MDRELEHALLGIDEDNSSRPREASYLLAAFWSTYELGLAQRDLKEIVRNIGLIPTESLIKLAPKVSPSFRLIIWAALRGRELLKEEE